VGESGEKRLGAGVSPVDTRGAPALPLALGIATTCLCFAAPFGVPAILFALRARRAHRAGAADLARTSARWSLVCSAIAIVLGALVEVFLLIRHLAAGFQ
jgi:hypothetical protein